MNYIEAIKERKSVRTFDKNKKIDEALLNEIKKYINISSNPFNLKIEWRLLNCKEFNLSSPVIVGENWYIGGKLKKEPLFELAFGFEFEEIVLFLQTKNIGTTWMTGTLSRDIFEKAMDLNDDEVIKCFFTQDK